MAFGTTARGAIHVLGMMCEEVSKTGGFGLAGSHGVLILKGHGWDNILDNKFSRGPIGRDLGTSRWVSLVVLAVLGLSQLRAPEGVETRQRGQRGCEVVFKSLRRWRGGLSLLITLGGGRFRD